MRHLFIINPAAGRPESTARLEPLLSRLSFPTRWPILGRPGTPNGWRGDGGPDGGPVCASTPAAGTAPSTRWSTGAAGFDNAAVTCVPKGTGNDFLKLFRPPASGSCSMTWRPWPPAPQRAFDLMDCNGKLGLDVVCKRGRPHRRGGAPDIRTCALSRYRRLSSIPDGAGHLRASAVPDHPVPTAWTGRSGRPPSCASATAVALRRRLHARAGRHAGRRCAGCPGVGRSAASLSSAWWASTPRGSTGSTPNLSPTGTASPSPFLPGEITVVVDGEVMRGTRFTVRLSP